MDANFFGQWPACAWLSEWVRKSERAKIHLLIHLHTHTHAHNTHRYVAFKYRKPSLQWWQSTNSAQSSFVVKIDVKSKKRNRKKKHEENPWEFQRAICAHSHLKKKKKRWRNCNSIITWTFKMSYLVLWLRITTNNKK